MKAQALRWFCFAAVFAAVRSWAVKQRVLAGEELGVALASGTAS
jgi:hypothetical protein